MIEDHPHGGAAFSSRRVLRPEVGDRHVQIEPIPMLEKMQTKSRGGLSAGKCDCDRVASPAFPGLGVGKSAPKIEDDLAAAKETHGRADLAPGEEVLDEGVRHRLEAFQAETFDSGVSSAVDEVDRVESQ